MDDVWPLHTHSTHPITTKQKSLWAECRVSINELSALSSVGGRNMLAPWLNNETSLGDAEELLGIHVC